MKQEFLQIHKDAELNKIVIEEDNLIFYADFIEGQGKNYIMTGKAVIEGETYNDFKLEFQLENEPLNESIEDIINSDWQWYDYIC